MIYPPNVRCHRGSLCSQRVRILLPCSLECVYMCVCVCGPGPNGETTAHQILFDYGCWGSGTMSVIRQIYTWTKKKTTPHLQSKWGEKKKKEKNKSRGDIYWLMMSPGGNVSECYHTAFERIGRSFLHLFLLSAPCKERKKKKNPHAGWIFHKVHSGTIMHSAKCSPELIIPPLCA